MCGLKGNIFKYGKGWIAIVRKLFLIKWEVYNVNRPTNNSPWTLNKKTMSEKYSERLIFNLLIANKMLAITEQIGQMSQETRDKT